MKNNGVIYIILACFLWGLDTLVRYPLVFSGESISRVVFWEHAILLVCFLPYLFASLKKVSQKKLYWGLFIVLGMGGSAAATLMFTKAFSLAHPTVVVLIQKTQPIFALLLARFWLKESFSKRFYFFAPLAFLGAIILIGQDVFNLGDIISTAQSGSLTGYLYAFGASLLWGGATVVGRYLSTQGFQPRELTTMRVFFATLFFIPYFAIESSFLNLVMPLMTFAKVGVLSFLSGILGLSLYYRGLKSTKAKFATIAEMTFPIWVIILNWIILKQTINASQILGATILLLSIYFLQYKSGENK